MCFNTTENTNINERAATIKLLKHLLKTPFLKCKKKKKNITKPGQSEHVDGLSHLPWPAQSTQTTVYIFGEKSEKPISSSTISEVTGRCSDRQYFTEDYSKVV